MRVARVFKLVSLIVAIAAILSYSLAADDIGFGALAVLGAAIAWWARGSFVAEIIPRILLNLALIGSVLLVGASTLSGVTVERIAELVVALIIIKLFDRTTARDYMELYTLAVFLAIAAIMTSVRLEVGLALAVFIPLTVTGVMLLQVYAGQERLVHFVREDELSRLRTPGNVVVGHQARQQFRRVAALGLLGGLCVATAVFVLVPRGIGSNFLGSINPAPSGLKTSFKDSVELGRAGFLSQSTTPVMHVRVEDAAGVPMGGPEAVYYMRGNVLDEYNTNSNSWERRSDGEGGTRVTTPTPTLEHVLPGYQEGPTLVQTITLLRPSTPKAYLFAIHKPTTIKFDRDVKLSEGIRDQTMWATDVSGDLKYQVESVLIDVPRTPMRPAPESFASPKINEIAREILVQAGIEPQYALRDQAEDRAAAAAFRDYLQSFLYTTEIKAPPPDADPIEWFLTDAKEGHCEYFASAMAALCRSVGIGARVITGYVAAEWNEASGLYVVRESNAHAWVEVRDGVAAYRTYDPTPPADLRAIHQPKGGILARIRGLLDAVNHAWVARVVTFDQGVREDLVRSGGRSGRLTESLRELVERSKAGGVYLALRAVSVGMVTFVGLTLVGLLIPRAIRRLRRNQRETDAPLQAEPPAWAPGSALYDRLLNAWNAAGHPKPAWSPPLQHAKKAELASDLPRRIVELFYRARFGGEKIDPTELNRATSEMDRFEQEVGSQEAPARRVREAP